MGEVLVLRKHCGEEVVGGVEQAHVEEAVVVRIEWEVSNFGLDQVLEEMRAETQIGQVVSCLAGRPRSASAVLLISE